MNQNPELLTSKEASAYLRLAERTLTVWRCTGKVSIPYIKIGGKVLYKKSDLTSFIESNLHSSEAV
jgi:excisionase family DNA binding protein